MELNLSSNFNSSATPRNIDTYDLTKFNEYQMSEIRLGLSQNLDVSIYAKPEFNEYQMNQIRRGLEQYVDVSIYAKPEFTSDQMDYIRLGLENNLGLSIYSKPEFINFQMEVIECLEKNLNLSFREDSKFNQSAMMGLRELLLELKENLEQKREKLLIMEMSKSNNFVNEKEKVVEYSSQEFTYEEMALIRAGLGDPSKPKEKLYSPIIPNYPLNEKFMECSLKESEILEDEDLKSGEGEVIISIEKIEDYLIKITEDSNSPDVYYSGFELVTSNGKYQIVISHEQHCCEESGYVMTEDDPEKFIGSEILSITRTDDCSLTRALEEELESHDDKQEKIASTQFLNINTNKGLFQLVVYNCHNGYYGHPILVIKDENVLYRDKI